MWNKVFELNGGKTPCYIYDLDRVRENAESFVNLAKEKNIRVVYATMANPRIEILEVFNKAGIGAFVNSIKHLHNALSAGIPVDKIVYAGSGHNEKIMDEVAPTGITYCADSLQQLKKYFSINPKGKVGCRVNIGSLLSSSRNDPAPRLGMEIGELVKALTYFPEVSMLHVYVGTNLTNPVLYKDPISKLVKLAKQHANITEIDLGGGFAFSPSDPEHNGMWEIVLQYWDKATCILERPLRLTIEPGRSMVRSAGTMFATVTDVKIRKGHQYVLVDTSFTWYPRTVIHDAVDHSVSLLHRIDNIPESLQESSICGSSTFSGDFLYRGKLPTVQIDDILKFSSAGAYNESMHLDFLGFAPPSIFLFEKGKLKEINNGA